MSSDEKITVHSVNAPGREHWVDRAKYEAMRKAILRVLPGRRPA